MYEMIIELVVGFLIVIWEEHVFISVVLPRGKQESILADKI